MSAQKLVKRIECVYLPEKDVMIELDEVKNATYSTEIDILKVHMGDYIKWVSMSMVVSNSKL